MMRARVVVDTSQAGRPGVLVLDGPSGSHSLTLAVSSWERCCAHAIGFGEVNGVAPAVAVELVRDALARTPRHDLALRVSR